MKNDRRHQLETNVLADHLGTGLMSVKSVLPLILGALVLVAVGSIAWGLLSANSKKKESVAWSEYYFSIAGGDADSFIDVAKQYPSSSAAGWAKQTAGDQYLEKGIGALYRNRSEGEDLIKQSLKAYEEVLSKSPGEELRAKAIIGMAHAHESLGQLDDAADYYKQFAATSAPRQRIQAANESLAFLSSEEGKGFYDWFNQLDPKPDAPIELPANLGLPPTQPNIEFGPTGDTTSSDTLDPSTLPPLQDSDPQPTTGTETPSISLPPAIGPVEVPAEIPAETPGGESEADPTESDPPNISAPPIDAADDPQEP